MGLSWEDGCDGGADRPWRKPDANVMVATFGRFRGPRFHVRPTRMLESSLFARVAELVDALASGASGRKVVGVQVPPRAQRTNHPQRMKSPSPGPAEGRVRGFFVSARWRFVPARGAGAGFAWSFKPERGCRFVDGSINALPLEREWRACAIA